MSLSGRDVQGNWHLKLFGFLEVDDLFLLTRLILTTFEVALIQELLYVELLSGDDSYVTLAQLLVLFETLSPLLLPSELTEVGLHDRQNLGLLHL